MVICHKYLSQDYLILGAYLGRREGGKGRGSCYFYLFYFALPFFALFVVAKGIIFCVICTLFCTISLMFPGV